MSFQTSVRYDMTFGVPGEIRFDGPVRSKPGLLNSASAAYNIIGATAFTQPAAGGAVVAGGATDPFFGILAKPKNYSSFGTSADGPLAPTLTLANNVEAEFVSMGFLCISVAAACAIGDLIEFDTTTGALSTVAPIAVFNATLAITTGVMTVNSITAGSVGIGTTVLDSSGNVIAHVISLGSGTGGTGTYNTDNVAGVAAANYTALTVPAVGKRFVPRATIDQTPQTGAGLALARLTN